MAKSKMIFCHVPGSLLKQWQDITKVQCNFINFSIWLNNSFHFGYVCVAILAIIIIISIFGKIKENYRWFILNQALWDLLMCYDYIDNNKFITYFFQNLSEETRGFERFVPVGYDLLIDKIMVTQPYSSLFMLCSTRFMCLFFMRFYEKLTQKRRILYFILSFNFICIFVHFNYFLEIFTRDRVTYLDGLCKAKEGPIRQIWDECNAIKRQYFYPDFWQNVLKISYTILSFIVEFKPPFFLLFSIIATFMIIFKICKQAKFQLKHNPKDFLNSLRVSSVMALQTLLYIFVFFFSLLKSLDSFKVLFNFIIEYSVTKEDCNSYASLCLILPEWMWSETYGLADPRIIQTVVQLRIFLESIIVLSLMTGYREAIFKFLKFLFKSASNPLERYIKLKSGFSKTQVTIISNSSSKSIVS